MRLPRGQLYGPAVAIAVAIAIFESPARGETDAPSAATSTDSRNLTPDAVVKRLLEVNSVWLEPRPTRLSYRLSGTLLEDGGKTKQLNRIWIDGDNARWEMEAQLFTYPRSKRPLQLPLPPKELEYASYTLVVRGDEESYVRAPRANMLLVSRNARDLGTLRQGITWSTAMHALQSEGLPDDARIIEQDGEDPEDVVVLEMTFKKRKNHVGLGLYHSYYGSISMPTGKARLHIKLPDYVPVREEWVNRNSRIEYGPEFFRVGGHRAPQSMSYVGLARKNVRWELKAQFKIVQGHWLLDRAVNTHGGTPVAEFTLSDVSTERISPLMFELPAED